MPSISVKGNKTFVSAVGIVAKQHNTTTAELVRSLLEKEYGAEIDKAVSFLSSDYPRMHKNGHSGINHERQGVQS